MTDFLPKDILDGLDEARRRQQRRKARFRIEVGGESFPVLRRWEDGFAMDAEVAPPLRGFVDLCEGPSRLFQCLIVASALENGERRYEFKRATAATDRPPVDFARDDDPAIALPRPDAAV